MDKFTLLKKLSLVTLLMFTFSMLKAQSCASCAGAIMNATTISFNSGTKTYCYDATTTLSGGINVTGTGVATIYIKAGVMVIIPPGQSIQFSSSSNSITLCDGAVLNVQSGLFMLGSGNTITMQPTSKLFVYGVFNSSTGSKIYVTGNTAIESCSSTQLTDNATITFINPGNKGKFYFISRGAYDYISGQSTFTASPYGSRMNWIAFDKTFSPAPVTSGGTANADICNYPSCVIPYTSVLWSVITHKGQNDPCGEIITAPFPLPTIGLAKRVSSAPALQANGSYNITYSFIVKNGSTGTTSEDLKTVQVTDDLTSTFPAPATFTVTSVATTGTIVKNAAYNGSVDKNLLVAGSSTLAIGVSATITLSINVKLNGTTGTFKNSATASCIGTTSGDSDSDVSNDGSDATPAGSITTDVTLPGKIDLTKTGPIGPVYPTLPGNGTTYDLTYVFNVANTGASTLSNVQVTDDLTALFPPSAVFSVTSITTTGTIAANNVGAGAFNGNTIKNLLIAGSSTLAVGASGTITLKITVDMKGQIGTYNNLATATATDPYSNPTSDVAQTLVDLTVKGTIGLTKSAPVTVVYANPTPTAISSIYDVTYVFSVKNTGAVPIDQVQVTDDLAAVYLAPATFSVISLVTTGIIAANGIYDGKTNKTLLAANGKLAVGATETITLKIRVDLKGKVGTFDNVATATAIDGNGNNTSAISDVIVQLTQKGTIDLTKTGPVVAVYPTGASTFYDLTYTFTLKNTGLVMLDSIQVTDNLAATFPTPAVVSITSLTASAGLTKNAAYNGTTITSLLKAGIDNLAPGATATITLIIKVDLKGKVGIFSNIATATAKDPNKNNTSDVSQADVNLTQKGVIDLTKSGPSSAVYPSPIDSTYDVTYVFTLKNTGVVALNTVQVTDDLTSVFLAPATFSIKSLATTGTVSPNVGPLPTPYDGKTNKNLLANGGTLAIGATATITLKINVNLKGKIGNFSNTATATAKDPNGNTATDPSTVVITLTRKGAITLIKSVSPGIVLPKANNTYDIVYTLKIINEDIVPLSKLKLFDTLSTTFPAPAVVTVKKPIGIVVKGSGIVKEDINYNGISANKFGLLDSTSTLGAKDTAIITLTVNVDLKGAVGTFYNSATTKALDPTNNMVTGTSNASAVILTKTGIIELQKSTSTPLLYPKADGTYDVKYTFRIINKEQTPIKNLRLIDTLTKTFPPPAIVSANAPVVIKGSKVKAENNYDGVNNFELLNLSSSLAINDTAIISLDVNVDLNGAIGVFKNYTLAEGFDLNGTLISDTSMAKVKLTEKGVIGISKSITPKVILPKTDGSYDLTYTFKVKNLGKVDLSPVSVFDTLTKTFPAPANFSVGVPKIVTGITKVKPNLLYDGKAQFNLLDPLNSRLNPGDSAIITVAVNVNLNGGIGKFYNIAKAIAQDSLKNITIDISNDGLNVDTTKHDTTIIILTRKGVIGVSKSISPKTIYPKANGTFDLTYTFKVKNLGKVNLTPVSLYDTLTNTFPAPAAFIVGIPKIVIGITKVKPNLLYDGKAQFNLLDPLNSKLSPGDSAIITLDVNVDLKGEVGKFYNIAKAVALDSLKNTTIDISNDGLNVDTTKHDTTIIVLTRKGVVGVSKSVSPKTIYPKADGTFDLTYTFKVKNLGKVNLSPVSVFDTLTKTFPAPATFSAGVPKIVTGIGKVKPNLLYNGKGISNLLDSLNSRLSPGDSAIITLAVNVNLNGGIGKFYNIAKAIAQDTLKNITIDISNDGLNVDTTKHDTTIIILTRKGIIGVAKSVSPKSPIPNANGTFDLTYTFKVKNLGKVNLAPVSLYDTLTKTFPAPAAFIVGIPKVVTGIAKVKPNLLYDGKVQFNLLDSLNSKLNPGDSAIITLAVNVDLKGEVGKFYNIATAVALDSLKNTTIDISNDGLNIDTTKNDTTIIILSPKGIIGVAKAGPLGVIKPNAKGTFDIAYTFTVKNLGKVDLSKIQVRDNLAKTFPAPAIVTVTQPLTVTGVTTVKTNAGYNGTTDIGMLDSTASSLAVGATATITMLINVDLKGSPDGVFKNSAKATGTDINGTDVWDISNNGVDPNNDPKDTTTTDVTLIKNPLIGIAKSAATPILKDGKQTYEITYTFVVKNYGSVNLNMIQVTDNLKATFPNPLSFQKISLTSTGGLTVNTNYNGSTDVNLLDPTSSSLARGSADATITLVIEAKLGYKSNTYYNTAIATAVGENNTGNTTDISCNGQNPDPNGNGVPNDTGEDIPTPVVIEITDIFIPDAISPNGDTKNDKFDIKGIENYPNNTLLIFNRWGAQVYSTKAYNNTWDGTSDNSLNVGGNLLPDGVYYYILDLGNGSKVYTGYIYLKR